MKRSLVLVLLTLTLVEIAVPVAAARRVVVHHRGPRHRTTVVVHRSFPIHRTLPRVVVRPSRVTVRAVPRVYLAAVVAPTVVVALPPAPSLVWEDRETLVGDDDWCEFTLVAERAGRALWLEVVGETQFSFVEVVFDNGDTRVVDFEDRARPSGIYRLLDFADGRRVDHVRVVARARVDESKVVLRLS